jgi:Domain of unknown function (DUF4421)
MNAEKFSYQAGLLQNEWQKKSAGSLLYGGEIYYGAIFGDSSLVPTLADPDIEMLGLDKFHFFSIGPGVGYAYTFVYKEHYFLLGSATINLALRFSNEISTTLHQQASYWGFRPNYILHAGAGYNGNKWALSLLWVDTQLFMSGQRTDYRYTALVGNYRLTYTRRFALDRKIKKILEPIPQILGQ